MTWLAGIYITLKPVVNDPQGLAIKGGLQMLGFANVQSVRAGKYIEVKLEAADRAAAEADARQMCTKLLANPVIEDFRFDLEPLEEKS